jgi:hypothetical protein
VGINDYPADGSDLNGCISDAKDMGRLLVGHFDFARTDIAITDAEATRPHPGRDQGLLAGARAADVLVFTNSRTAPTSPIPPATTTTGAA